MSEQFHKVFIEIFLLFLFCVPAILAASMKTISQEIAATNAEKIYVQPAELVIREKNGGAERLVYHFITDYPHPQVPTNNYIKPWEVIASKPIRVKNIEGNHSRILKKNNILYLAKSDLKERE